MPEHFYFSTRFKWSITARLALWMFLMILTLINKDALPNLWMEIVSMIFFAGAIGIDSWLFSNRNAPQVILFEEAFSFKPLLKRKLVTIPIKNVLSIRFIRTVQHPHAIAVRFKYPSSNHTSTHVFILKDFNDSETLATFFRNIYPKKHPVAQTVSTEKN